MLNFNHITVQPKLSVVLSQSNMQCAHTYSKLLEYKLNFWCGRIFSLLPSSPPMFAFFLMWCFSLSPLQIFSFFPYVDHCISFFFFPLKTWKSQNNLSIFHRLSESLQEADLHIFFFIQSFEFSKIKSNEDNAQHYVFLTLWIVSRFPIWIDSWKVYYPEVCKLDKSGYF